MEPSKKRMLLQKKQGILQVNLNDKRKEQSNTKQWLQQKKKNKNYQANKQKNAKLWIQQRNKNCFTNGSKSSVEIRAKMSIHALKHLKRK